MARTVSVLIVVLAAVALVACAGGSPKDAQTTGPKITSLSCTLESDGLVTRVQVSNPKSLSSSPVVYYSFDLVFETACAGSLQRVDQVLKQVPDCMRPVAASGVLAGLLPQGALGLMSGDVKTGSYQAVLTFNRTYCGPERAEQVRVGVAVCDKKSAPADQQVVSCRAQGTESSSAPGGPSTTAKEWSDSFDGSAVDRSWRWVDPDADGSYSLTANPGYLRLSTPCHDHIEYRTDFIDGNCDAGRMVQSLTGDFLVETKVVMGRTENSFQWAGILVFKDKDNWIALNRGFSNGNSLGGRWIVGGTPGGQEEIRNFDVSPTYLRLERRGEQFTLSYSRDGSQWSTLATPTVALPETLDVGLAAGNANNCFVDVFQADFDYFRLTTR